MAMQELDPFRLDPIVIYDVGARDELQPHWNAWAESGHEGACFVLFEPHGPAAAELRQLYRNNHQVRVVESGLYHVEGAFTLHVTRHGSCSSLRQPDFDVLSRYHIGAIFEVVEEVSVSCGRMDDIVRQNGLRPPDFCKLDVQGVEYEVLLGMGALLEHCLVLEMETHLYPIYKGQKLLPDVIALLDRYGFTLRDLRPQRHFDTDYVEVNACFAKREDLTPPSRLPRLALLKQVLQLHDWPLGRDIFNGLDEPKLQRRP